MKTNSFAALALLAASSLCAQVPAASSGVAFPRPFVVEHQHVETEADGSTFTTEAVTDYYSGSWLVSVHPDGSRVILDFARREITEVDAAKGTYWTLTFRQMGDLRRRLQRAEERPATARPQSSRSAQAAQKPEIRIEEVPEKGDSGSKTARPASAAGRSGLRHLKASAKGAPAVEVWVDPALPLGPAALTAIESFENDALGSTVSSDVRTAVELESAARRAGAGVPVRARRSPAEGSSGSSEDIALRAEPLAALPQNLLKIDDGFRRVSSPLENMVAFSEEEASRDSSRRTK